MLLFLRNWLVEKETSDVKVEVTTKTDDMITDPDALNDSMENNKEVSVYKKSFGLVNLCTIQ